MNGFKKLFDSGKKILAVWLVINATLWVYMSYILAFIGREEIAESLSEKVVVTIIAVFATYATSTVIEHISEAKHGDINKKDSEDSI